MLKWIRNIVEFVKDDYIDKKVDYPITFVYLPCVDFYSDQLNRRPQKIMKALAELGCNVIFINTSEIFYQVDDIEYPYPNLPNFHLVRVGQNVRHLFKGRVVYWINDSRYYNSVDQSGADLVVYDSLTDPDGLEKYKYEMEKKADIVFITPDRIYEHGRYCKEVHILLDDDTESWRQRAAGILEIIERVPDRPKPLM